MKSEKELMKEAGEFARKYLEENDKTKKSVLREKIKQKYHVNHFNTFMEHGIKYYNIKQEKYYNEKDNEWIEYYVMETGTTYGGQVLIVLIGLILVTLVSYFVF